MIPRKIRPTLSNCSNKGNRLIPWMGSKSAAGPGRMDGDRPVARNPWRRSPMRLPPAVEKEGLFQAKSFRRVSMGACSISFKRRKTTPKPPRTGLAKGIIHPRRERQPPGGPGLPCPRLLAGAEGLLK